MSSTDNMSKWKIHIHMKGAREKQAKSNFDVFEYSSFISKIVVNWSPISIRNINIFLYIKQHAFLFNIIITGCKVVVEEDTKIGLDLACFSPDLYYKF